jgi:hypothetical protein
MRQAAMLLGTTLALLSLLFLSGNAGDSGCGGDGGVTSAEELCIDSGGSWDNDSCPFACWPPACGEAVNQMCPAVCGSEPVCRCPDDAPYWVDGQGCTGAQGCPTPPTCAEAGGVCAALTAQGVLCPSSHPTPNGSAGTCMVGASCCL